MQKQAQLEVKGQGSSNKDEPNSPQYLLGAPTSEPVFFKSPGGRGSTQGSPAGAQGSAGQGQTAAGPAANSSTTVLGASGKSPGMMYDVFDKYANFKQDLF